MTRVTKSSSSNKIANHFFAMCGLYAMARRFPGRNWGEPDLETLRSANQSGGSKHWIRVRNRKHVTQKVRSSEPP